MSLNKVGVPNQHYEELNPILMQTFSFVLVYMLIVYLSENALCESLQKLTSSKGAGSIYSAEETGQTDRPGSFE